MFYITKTARQICVNLMPAKELLWESVWTRAFREAPKASAPHTQLGLDL